MALFFTGKIMEIMKIAKNVYENYGKCKRFHVFTGFTFVVLFGIVELCIL